MRAIVKSLLLVAFLISCGTTEESRYRDTEALERPPVVVSAPSREQRTVDDSTIPEKKQHAGLGSDVYMSSPALMTIKQPFDDAWNTIRRALKQSGLKITDFERTKGFYYVTQETTDDSGFLTRTLSFFSADPTVYLLTVKPSGEETTVTATVANKTEQDNSAAKDGAPEYSNNAGSAEDVLQLLFKTLRDKLDEE
jgi:hypothetical protein